MIIAPRIRGYICTTAHPIGCRHLVREQAAWTQSRPIAGNGAPLSVLVIGGSAGYGLASRITCAFGRGARTLSLSYEKEPTLESTGTAGWHNTRAFEELASSAGLYARSVNADAFADETKAHIADIVRQDLGGLDLLVYSLASPVRKDPESGTIFRSAIKAVGRPVRLKTLHVEKGAVQEIDVPTATEDEIHATVKVMGGEDWERWTGHLQSQGLLNRGFRTVAYTYIGSELTWPVYWDGTLGKAKEDLDRAAAAIRSALAPLSGDARVAVLKGVVTQASSAIPAMPLYISLLFKVMKEQGLHEDCQQNIDRLFRSAIFDGDSAPIDPHGRWRADDWELRADVQAEVKRRWQAATSDNVMELSDLAGFRRDFLRIFGFGVDEVDYTRDVSPLG
jgi:enoyl-[acyl-carrier protein] reductase/trans-2-enoyl-CoA reductase (NAD+)